MSYRTPRSGQNLKVLREERGLMSKDLAAAAGIQASHYSELENGKRSITPPVLEKLAGALEMDAGDLRARLSRGGPGDRGGDDNQFNRISSNLREDPMVYKAVTSYASDANALALHLVAAMSREDVFRLLRELTEAGEAGDNVALRKARALLEMIPDCHATANNEPTRR